ncbi:hypothetical protein M0813_26732 [Anaeramoeba flamelloides]|uniref:Taste receptor type 2 n=1 Tax=Anaeramoeba flamelloides TaxID=1746091 RepID=A0ABQ8XX47_9EUKA|nr:hypothetical protein M0813_26732 [Anaeramoeba flamelloides]
MTRSLRYGTKQEEAIISYVFLPIWSILIIWSFVTLKFLNKYRDKNNRGKKQWQISGVLMVLSCLTMILDMIFLFSDKEFIVVIHHGFNLTASFFICWTFLYFIYFWFQSIKNSYTSITDFTKVHEEKTCCKLTTSKFLKFLIQIYFPLASIVIFAMMIVSVTKKVDSRTFDEKYESSIRASIAQRIFQSLHVLFSVLLGLNYGRKFIAIIKNLQLNNKKKKKLIVKTSRIIYYTSYLFIILILIDTVNVVSIIIQMEYSRITFYCFVLNLIFMLFVVMAYIYTFYIIGLSWKEGFNPEKKKKKKKIEITKSDEEAFEMKDIEEKD